MKTKSKIIIGSLLVIALCVSLIAGTTFALFASESSTNIAVTSGKVDVTATIGSVQTTGKTTSWVNGTDDMYAGKVDIVGNEINLSNIGEGDGVRFKITVNNQSTMPIKYRIIYKVVEDNGLLAGLKLSNIYAYDRYTTWSEKLTAGKITTTSYITITMPVTTTISSYQGKSCKLAVIVEAVQGNTTTHNAIEITNAAGEVKSYASFNEIYSLENDSTLRLYEDVTISNTVVLSSVWDSEAFESLPLKNFTFDGQGHTITSLCPLDKNVLQFHDDYNELYAENVTVKNLTINGTGKSGIVLGGDSASHRLDNVNVTGQFSRAAISIEGTSGGVIAGANVSNTIDLEQSAFYGDGVLLPVGLYVNPDSSNPLTISESRKSVHIDTIFVDGHASTGGYSNKLLKGAGSIIIDAILTAQADQDGLSMTNMSYGIYWQYGTFVVADGDGFTKVGFGQYEVSSLQGVMYMMNCGGIFNNATIKLTRNLSLAGVLTGSLEKAHMPDGATIDLNGHTISDCGVDKIVVHKGGTLKNGTVSCAEGTSYAVILADSDVTVENVTINGGIGISGCKNAVVKNCTITSGYYRPVALYNGAATATLIDCTLIGGEKEHIWISTTAGSSLTLQGTIRHDKAELDINKSGIAPIIAPDCVIEVIGA